MHCSLTIISFYRYMWLHNKVLNFLSNRSTLHILSIVLWKRGKHKMFLIDCVCNLVSKERVNRRDKYSRSVAFSNKEDQNLLQYSLGLIFDYFLIRKFTFYKFFLPKCCCRVFNKQHL